MSEIVLPLDAVLDVDRAGMLVAGDAEQDRRPLAVEALEVAIGLTAQDLFPAQMERARAHRIGTDRLWVTWMLDSERVRERLQNETNKQESLFPSKGIPSLVQVDLNDVPRRNESSRTLDQEILSIEIPADINALQNEKPELAVEWRQATRWAFTEAIASGYFVEEFYRVTRINHSVGIYLLSQKHVEVSVARP